MCGICGVVGTERKEEAAIATRRMLAAIYHRGPDEEGLLERPSVALGMRRLSIIDLSGGSQPVWNEDARVAVVYNGEIYNFRELRESLLSSGHFFRTHSDTEVIVHAYEEWGADCVRRFRGMFAFAIWDGRTNPARMLLARDRLGIKPLYYTRVSGVLLFASEVRALLASDLVPREISPSAVESYLLFGSVAEPETLVAGVLSLPPGHLLQIPERHRRRRLPEALLGYFFRGARAARFARCHFIRGGAPPSPAAAGNRSQPSDLGRSSWSVFVQRHGFHGAGRTCQPGDWESPHLHRCLPGAEF